MTLRDNQNWRVIKSREVADCSPWLRVTKESVQLPDGHIVHDYYHLELPDFVIIFTTTTDDQALFLRQYKHGLRKTCLTLPAGHIENNETPLVAAKRELMEETGYQCDDWLSLGSFVGHGNLGMNTGHFFWARGAIAVAEADSPDLGQVSIVLKHQSETGALLSSGAIPLLHHATAISLAMTISSSKLR